MPCAFCYHPAVRSFLKIFLMAWIVSAMVPLPATNGMTDDEKKAAFLKAREEMQTVESPTPEEATPTPKPKPASHHKPTPTPTPAHGKHKAIEEPASTPAPEPIHKTAPEPTATPRHKPTPKSGEQPYPEAHKTPTPALINWSPSPTPTPAPTPKPMPTPAPAQSQSSRNISVQPNAPVIIQKEDIHYEPQPPPPPEPHGWWPWSRPTNYRYLTNSVIEAIRRAPVAKGRWRYIVVHNSGTHQGNAKIFDFYHRHTRHMPNGLAYHFVIGNGTSSGDGEIEIGDRWKRQIDGGHVHSDFLNSIALGICLVGDFNRELPTKAQIAALDELIRYLRERVGKYEGHVAVVKAHKEINPVPTDCPGDRFPYHWLHSSFDL